MARVTFLLPAAERFGGQRWSAATAAALARGDRARALATGRRAQLLRHFRCVGSAWPIAALSRQVDCGDAEGWAWMRADPAYLRPDIAGVRLMAHGPRLVVEEADVAALLPALKPVFGDAGFALDAPDPGRWYLRLPTGTPMPAFPDPDEALGGNLLDHLDGGAATRRWRLLGNEAQIVLHNHPWNARRAEAGKLPINALWFWGGGALPVLRSREDAAPTVSSEDATVRAIAAFEATLAPLPAQYEPARGDVIHDLAAGRDRALLDAAWLQPALHALQRGEIAAVVLDAEDGEVTTVRHWHRVRFWRGRGRAAARRD